MDIYYQKSRWKLYLGIAGVVIVLISLFYTNYLTGKLAAEERNKVELYVAAQEELNKETNEECEACRDFTIYSMILQGNTTIPVMLVNANGNIDDAINFGTNDPEKLEEELRKLQQDGIEPITNQALGVSIYYKESLTLRQLRFFPMVQLVLIAAFILFGYLGFSSARRAEQNRVWVGMAKETAHQLGTPISGIVAWIEHLRLIRNEDAEVHEILDELQKDVGRLELIADRFSKIGSAPELVPVNVFRELDQLRAYMQRRASRRVSFEFPSPEEEAITININPHLFDWVVENLLRNALDAMEGQGTISAEVYDDKDNVYIDIADTGKGIPANKFRTVFRPGYTTKKRGWGLGLSLAKRIIEEYHSGKIFVKASEEGKGTTFTIQLPKQAPVG